MEGWFDKEVTALSSQGWCWGADLFKTVTWGRKRRQLRKTKAHLAIRSHIKPPGETWNIHLMHIWWWSFKRLRSRSSFITVGMQSSFDPPQLADKKQTLFSVCLLLIFHQTWRYDFRLHLFKDRLHEYCDGPRLYRLALLLQVTKYQSVHFSFLLSPSCSSRRRHHQQSAAEDDVFRAMALTY